MGKRKREFLALRIVNFFYFGPGCYSVECVLLIGRVVFPGVSVLVVAQDRVSLVLPFLITLLPFLLDSLRR